MYNFFKEFERLDYEAKRLEAYEAERREASRGHGRCIVSPNRCVAALSLSPTRRPMARFARRRVR